MNKIFRFDYIFYMVYLMIWQKAKHVYNGRGYKYKETESIDFVESSFVDPPVYIYMDCELFRVDTDWK